jgi:hypothetical protein
LQCLLSCIGNTAPCELHCKSQRYLGHESHLNSTAPAATFAAGLMPISLPNGAEMTAAAGAALGKVSRVTLQDASVITVAQTALHVLLPAVAAASSRNDCKCRLVIYWPMHVLLFTTAVAVL